MNKKKTLLMLLITMSIFAISNISFAIGLGKIKVYSYLNELLSAEIELIGAESLNTELLTANLASPKDFIKANMSRPYFLTKLSFEIIRYEQQTVIYITSTKPVNYPFLDLLIELSWADGKLIKGYTILMDPPPANAGKTLVDRSKTLFNKRALIRKKLKFEALEQNAITAEPSNLATKNKITGSNNLTTNNNFKQNNNKITKPITTNDNIVKNIIENGNDFKQATITQDPIITNKANKQNMNKEQIITPKVKKQTDDLINAGINTINDATELENALGDNIEINKQYKPTGILQGIITAVKTNPLFSRSTIDSKALVEKAATLEDTTSKINNTATLQELLAKDTAQQKSQNEDPMQFSDLDVADLVGQKTKVIGKAGVINELEASESATNTSLYKQYGSQLILSFFMVLISGFFGLKLLKQHNFTNSEEAKVEKIKVKHKNLAKSAMKAQLNYPNSFELDNYNDIASDDDFELDDEITTKAIDGSGFDNDIATDHSVLDNEITTKTIDSSRLDDDITSDDDFELDDEITTKAIDGSGFDDDIATDHSALDDEIATKAIDDSGLDNDASTSIDAELSALKLAENNDNTIDEVIEIDMAAELGNNLQSNNDIENINLTNLDDDSLLSPQAAVVIEELGDKTEEINIKIDLAKQYLDVADLTSANNVLQEIKDIAVGTQKQEIDDLLAKLANSK